ncbi:MAG: hypothetical protein ACHQ0J_01325 [Candidatus Dormibacterales bacterium]
MPSNSRRHSTTGFTAADDDERWFAVELGLPIPTLIEQRVEVAVAPLSAKVDLLFAGAAGKPRPDLHDLDERLQRLGLTESDFAQLLTRRMGWEHRGSMSRARLVMARCRQGQPVSESEYAATLRILVASRAVDSLPAIRVPIASKGSR